MKEKLKRNKNKFIYGTLSVVCFLILFGATWQRRGSDLERLEYSVVVLGDSILGECRDETSIPEQLETLMGKSVFNGALGGTCMGRMDGEMRLGYTKDCLSVTGLAKAILADDFGVQQTVRIRESATEYFEETIDEMQSIDFGQVEVLLIEAGVNDYHAGTPIYPVEDDYDEYTFTGALRSVIRDIQKAHPDIRIVLVTPTFTWYRERNLTCEEYNLGGGILEEYVNAQISVASEMGVDIIDLYHDFYPHENWEDWEIYSRDGLHPNEAGRTMIAEAIADYLMEVE